MVGITIQNQVNQNDKPIGISFRRKDQLSGDVIWSVLERVSQSNSRFNALDTLVVTVHSVKMPGGFGKQALKSKGRLLSTMAHLKKSIVEVKTEENCPAHALVIAIAKVENDPNYKAYINGGKIRHAVQTSLDTSGIDLSNGGGIPELMRFQEHFRQYKIIVYHGLSCDDIMFEGQVDPSKRLNIYDDVEFHYHVIVKLTAAMAKKYVCKGCNKACTSYVTQSVTRRVAIARPVRRAHSRRYESPATTAIDILETPQVSQIISSAPRLKNRCANVSGVARSVEGKRRSQNTNVTNASVATVRRTKLSDTCVT